jgi:tetratricopeptide (TPR) repeat protein
MLALALVVGAGGAPALAQDGDLAKAKAEMAKLDYDAAIALLEQAEASGKNQPADMVEIYRAMAESHAAMGRTDAAETAFRRLLALDPSIELPAGSSPKLTGPFTGAREFLARRRIAVECRRGAPDAATLVVQSDPVDLVAGARLLTGDGRAVGDDARGQGRVALAIPGGTSPAGCAALDRHGNVLARADLSATPEEAVPDEGSGGATGGGEVVGTEPGDDRSRPIYARWWLYAGLGAAAGGVALYYGLKVQQAEDDLEELHRQTMQPDHMITYADALAVEDRGERYARNANIALVVTGVFAAVSGGLLVHQIVTDRRQDRDEGEPALGAAPLPGGAAVNLTLGF